MRVVHVTPFFAPAYGYGGPPRSVLALCQALQRTNVHVEVVTTTAGGESELAAGRDVEFEGVPVSYLHRTFPRRYFRAEAARRVLQQKAAEADLFHIHGCWNFMGWDGAAVARRHRRPYVSTPRGMLSPWSMSHGHTALKALSYSVFERPTQQHAAVQHATSELERDELLRLEFGRPIRVIPNGVDIPAAVERAEIEAFQRRVGLRPHQRVVLTVSRLHPKKGLEVLGEAMRAVVAGLPESTLLVVGSGDRDYERELRSLLKAQLEDRVVFTGELTGRDRDVAYAVADVFALASAAENFGLVVAEAMAASLPVVVSRELPWPQIETWGAGKLVDRSPAAIAAALRHYLLQHDQARAAGAMGLATIQRNFSWDSIAVQMMRVYAECVTQPRG